MASPLDAATSIVRSALFASARLNSRCVPQSQHIGKNLFADGTLTILDLDERPGMEKAMRCRFDYPDHDGVTSLQLTLNDELAYRVLRAREKTGNLFIRARLVLHLDIENSWSVRRLQVLDR